MDPVDSDQAGLVTDVVVVGAGIIGLTTALELARAGVSVRIQSAQFSPHTTSDVAAAIWYPFQAQPRERVLAWSAHTFAVFEDESRMGIPGVSMLEMLDLFADPVDDPWWSSAVPGWTRCTENDLPDGYVDGYKLHVPLVESSTYMRWLHEQLSQLDVPVSVGFVHELSDLPESFVVNCAGLGARELCRDEEMYPLRGVVLRTNRSSQTRSLADDEGPNSLAYIIPRSDDCILGGVAERGRESMSATDAEVTGILERCASLSPDLRDAEVLEVKVGLRPGRSTVRCQADETNDRIIHNYGHGGSGFTICWGCAREATQLILERLACVG